MNALDPIRHAYGLAEGAPPAPGTPGHAEYAALDGMRQVLDGMPRARPDASVLDALTEAARDAGAGGAGGDETAPLRAAYGEAPPPVPDSPEHAEFALLDAARTALDALPRQRPDASVIAAITAAAREARETESSAGSAALVQAAYDEAAAPVLDAPSANEYALLRSTREVLDQMPRQRPDASVLATIASAAKARTLRSVQAAYGEADPPPEGTAAHTEYRLLDGIRTVLDRAPKERPDISVIAAVSAAAAGATGSIASVRPVARSVGDRAAAPRRAPIRRLPVWIGRAAVLVVIATAGVWAVNEGLPEASLEAAQDVVAEVEQDAVAPEVAERATEGGDVIEQEAAPDLFAGALSQSASPTVAEGRLRARAESLDRATEGRVASGARARPSTPPPAPADIRRDIASSADAIAAEPEMEEALLESVAVGGAAPAAWEAGEDVRLLSLRLQHIAETNEGIAWEAPPATFGARADSSVEAERLGGLRLVRDGDAPARVEVRMRTAPPDRSSGQ